MGHIYTISLLTFSGEWRGNIPWRQYRTRELGDTISYFPSVLGDLRRLPKSPVRNASFIPTTTDKIHAVLEVGIHNPKIFASPPETKWCVSDLLQSSEQSY